MEDKDAVMSWLEGLTQDDWREYHSDSEVQNIAQATLELLKEQEDVSNALIEQCDRVRRLRKELAEQPQIVLCKNCKHNKGNEANIICEIDLYRSQGNLWFCADGERKDNNV